VSATATRSAARGPLLLRAPFRGKSAGYRRCVRTMFATYVLLILVGLALYSALGIAGR
jgi:hypothetical protein